MRLRRVLLAGILSVVAVVCFHSLRPTPKVGTRNAANRPQGTNPQRGGAEVSSVGPLANTVVARLLAAAAEGRTGPVVPAAVRELLPSLEAPVANWKEFKPQKITVAPYPDMPVEFEVTSISEEQGRIVWTGRNKFIEGGFLVAAATESDWHATLVIPPAGAFDIHIAGDTVTTLAKNHDVDVCGAGGMTASTTDVAGAAQGMMEEPGTGAGDSLTTVDVLFFYDAEALAQSQNSPANFDTRMIANLASCNAALQNSAITNYRWRFLASYPVPAYTATFEMERDLDHLTGSLGDRSPAANPVGEFVNQKAGLHGADQVMLCVGGSRNWGGYAWIPAGVRPSSQLPFHASVIQASSSYLLFAHELAHNFGCRHDRATVGASDGDGNYYYGHRFLDRSGRDFGTIMSYAPSRYPYFSNPDVSFDGYVLGVADNLPRAANNARVLRECAPFMIASRTAVEPPTISSQPQALTVVEGQPFSLSVTASGSNLVYQWRKDTGDISGATNASYSKAAAVVADGGSYLVTISNVLGQVASAPALVTVTAAPAVPVTPSPPTTPTTPAPSGNSGGGGGGGALDGGFAAACGFLIMMRWLVKRRLS